MKAPCHDMTLDELLDDSLTQAVMTADRVDPSQLATMLRSVAQAIASSDVRLRAAPSATSVVSRFLRSTVCRGASRSDRRNGLGLRSHLCGAP